MRMSFRLSCRGPAPVMRMRRAGGARALTVALALMASAALPGCALVQNLTGYTAKQQARVDAAKQRAEALQLDVMRFADQYVEVVSRDTEQIAVQVEDFSRRVEIFDWRLATATSAVQIAAGPSPVTNAVDMLVMVSLSRRIVEAGWTARYGEQAQPLLESYRTLERRARRLLDGIGSREQKDELDALMDTWIAENPAATSAAFIRFDNLARTGPGRAESAARASPSLLSMIGLDPLQGIDPAVREVQQTRLLAERWVYYAQRLPILLDLQTSLIGARAAADPQVRQVTGSVGEMGRLSASVGRLADEAPALLAREREAAIAQLMGELRTQQKEMLALATEVRGALETGNVTAQSLDRLIQSTDRLVARFRSADGAATTESTGRPFDINEYTSAAVAIGAAARELQALATNVDGLAPQLPARVDQAASRAQELADHVFWRLLILILAALLCAVAYRLAARRISR